MLREVDRLAHRQIAAQLGITEAAAQQAVLDARRSLHAFEAGRALECDSVQTWLSAHEHARLRTRGVRAHLRDCGDCRDFSAALGSRPRDLAAVLPGIGAGGLVARVIGLFGGGGSGIKTALATGVLATAGAGLVAAPHGPAARAPDRGAAARPITVVSAPAGTRAVTPVADQRARSARERPAARRGERRATSVTSMPGDRAHDVTVRPASDTTRPSGGQAAAGAHAAGSPKGTSGDGPTRAVTTTSAPATTDPRPATPSTPSLPPGPVTDVVTPVLDAVTQTTSTTVDAVTKVVQDVAGNVGAQDVTDTVQGVTGVLTGSGR